MIYRLTSAEEPISISRPPADTAADLSERSQRIFTKPWQDSVLTKIPDIDELRSLLKESNPPLPSIGQVKAVFKQLNPRKATGSDGIPYWLLKRFCEELAPVIHNIVCSSIMQSKYPTPYKHALVSPVRKVTQPTDMENDFRQISVLPQLAKVLEKLLLKLNIVGLRIMNSQHAFTNGRSTGTALACMTQNWFNETYNSPNGGKGIHALFIDFRKAFDLVDHGILSRKLAEMYVSKWSWLYAKLFGREKSTSEPGRRPFIYNAVSFRSPSWFCLITNTI